MLKLVKVEFEGQSKSVIAKTKLEYQFETGDVALDNDDILKEAKELYEKANNYADAKTKQKII